MTFASLLLLLAPALGLVGAAPVHQFQTRDTNMQNFASAMLQISTNNRLWGVQQLGPSYDVSSDVDPDTSRIRTRKLMADLQTVCNASYPNSDANCKAISAFASAAVFGYDRDMTGADMFAALGTDRVNKMDSAINSFCSTGFGLGCSYLGNGFHSFSAQSTGVDAGPFTDQYSQCAVLDMVDGATTGMTTRSILDENLLNLVSFAPGSDGAISAGEAGESRIAHITPGGIGMDNTVGPAQVSKMLGLEKKSDLGLDVNADVNVDLNLQKKNDLGLDVNADVNADLALDTRQLGVGANANADVRVDLNAAANLGLGQKKRQIQAGSSTGAGAAAAALAKVAAKADINVDINARDVRRSRQPADKRVTYTTGDYTTTIDDDGKGTSSFSVTSPKVNLTTQSAPGGAAFNIQLPDDLFDNASQAGQDAISSLGLKRADIKHELHSISGVASSGATGIQMGDSTNSVGGSSSANVAAAIKEMQSRSEVEARQGNLLNGLPIVGGLLGGALKRDEIEPRQGNLLKGLPIVGGLLGGALKRDVVEERQGNLLNGLPIVGGLLGGALKRDEVEERQGNLLNGLPIVGGLLGGALKRDEVEERQGNLLNGLPIVGGLLGGALKRDVVEERQGNLLNGLPIVGGLLGGALKRDEVEERQGNLLNGLPIVGGLLGGALKRDEVEERQGNLLNGLPIVGDLLGGALKKRVHSPMAAGEYKKRHFRSRARRQANGVVVA